MAAGDMIKNRFQEFTDEQTGTRVVRLTEPDHVSHHMYFYNRMTTADGSHLPVSYTHLTLPTILRV